MPSSNHSYVIYAPTPWESPRQIMHNLAEALAAKHPVLYVDPPLSPLSPIRYGLRPSTGTRMRTVLNRRVRTAGRLKVFSPLVLPPVENQRMRGLSLPLLRVQIARAAARAGLERPVLVAARGLPELAGAVGESLRVGFVMDHPSAGASLMGRDADELETQTSAFCQSSNLLCTTSHALLELLSERGWHSELVPAGFPANLAGAFDEATEPEEYRALPRPILGYTGGIDDRLDFNLVLRLAERFSHGSLVFVGALSPRLSTDAREALAARANIHLLGPRPSGLLPAYIRYLDVALMPYRASLFTQYQSPIKVWEYLYAGPPIVGCGSVELRRYPPPLVNYGETPDAVPALVDQALADPEAGREERSRFALANTWEQRASLLDALVEERLDESSCAVPKSRLDAELSVSSSGTSL